MARRPVGGAALPHRQQVPVHLQPKRTGRDILMGILAIVALLVLLFGVPAALVVFIGWPLPTEVPSLEMLQQDIGPTVFLKILAVLVWIAWAQFTAAVLVEARAEMAGVLPGRVWAGGGSQMLARQLVAAALLLTTSAVQFAPSMAQLATGGGDGGPARPPTAATAQARAGGQDQQAQAEQQRQATAKPGAGQEARGGAKKVYTVQPPQGRHHESLWEIAERCLGDGRRYKEIFELNKGKAQPDGDKLTMASLIRPGWVLDMPADAVGVDVVHGEAPAPARAGGGSGGADTQTGADSTVQVADAQPGGGAVGAGGAGVGSAGGASDAGSGGTSRHAERPAPGDDSPARVPFELAGAGLLAAGLLAALGRRRRQQLWNRSFGRMIRRPRGDAAVAEEAIRLGAEPHMARMLDIGLRALSRALVEGGRSLPTIYAARLRPDGLDLLLTPPEREAPPPWIVASGGTVWHLPAAAAQTLPEMTNEHALAPYPGLVSLGTNETGRVLIDLEAASGVISLRGSADQSQAVLAGVAAELATNRWSDGMRLTLVGFGDELRLLAPDRVRAVATLGEVLPELEQQAAEVQRALAATGVDSVLTGRCRGIYGEAWTPHYVVVARQPDQADAMRLARLAGAAQRTAMGFLVAGEIPGATWSWDVNEDGRVRVDLLGLDVEGQLLPAAQYAALVELFRGVTDLGGDPAGSARLAGGDPNLPGSPALANILELQRPAAVDVRVLGPIEVAAPGELEQGRAAACTEMLVYLTMHPDGVHPTVLGGAVWPRGVSAEVRDSTIARLRDWLGHDASGRPNAHITDDSRLRLGSEVRTDWQVFTALLALASAESTTEAEYLEQALTLVRGPLLVDRPDGRYAWLAQEELEYEVPAQIADAAHRLSEIRLAGGDPGRAIEAARAGLRGAPDDEELWRDLLRGAHATGDPARLHAVIGEIRGRAQRPPATGMSPATEALIDELWPTWRQELAS